MKMIEIECGTLEERIIKALQKIYPITVSQLKDKLRVSRRVLLRELEKMQARGIIALEPLPDKIYIRLLRSDFRFIAKKSQKKFIKRSQKRLERKKEPEDEIMYV